MMVPPKVEFVTPPLKSSSAAFSHKHHHTGALFIRQVCHKLHFPIRTITTAQQYFHLFYSSHSLNDYPTPTDIALTSVLLACKTQETYKRIKDILSAAFLVANPDFSPDRPVEVGEEVRQSVVQYEEIMLNCIDFKFHHRLCPFKILVGVGGGVLRNDLNTMKLAWGLLQTLHLSPMILSYPGVYLAMACIIKARCSKSKDTKREYDYLNKMNMSRDIVDSIIKDHLSKPGMINEDQRKK